MTLTNMMLLGDVEFSVSAASFGFTAGSLVLDIDFSAPAGIDIDHDWAGYEPRLYSEGVDLPDTALGAELITIATQVAREFTLCLFEHEPLVSCKGELRLEQIGWRLALAGVAEVMGKKYPFKLSTSILRHD